MQRFTVNPNEFDKEREYISRNIDFTRRGYDLAGVTVRPYPVAPALSEGLIADNLQTVDNIRLWDHGPILNVYRQIQQIRPYYDFEDADVDRYTVDGEYRQVMLAAREQPASSEGISTVFSGLSILAVSAIKRTPQNTMGSPSVVAAWRLNSRESPVKSGTEWYSPGSM